MTKKSLLVEVTVYNEDTCEVISRHVETYTGQYHYEVTGMFDRIGQKFAPIADPYFAKEEA